MISIRDSMRSSRMCNCTLHRQLVAVGIAMLTWGFGSSAIGEYQGVTVTLHTSVNTPDGAMSVYRAYALFSNPGDFLIAVAGAPTLGNLVIQNLDGSGSALGAGFYNPAGTNRAPILQPGDPEEFQWETFVSIGGPYFYGDYPTGLSPGFPAFINGPSLHSNNIGWFLTPQSAGMAGNGVVNVDGLGHWGVLMMQLTVNAGEHVAGTVAVSGINNIGLAGGTTFQTMADQTFNSFPAPGALAIIGLAGLASHPRRRS
jgi:hypothetical protein